MKALIITTCAAALALPLVAQDRPNTTTTVIAQPPATDTAADSPLVAAAKATKKTTIKKSGIVITNENLLKTGGHIFIANPSNNAPLPAALPQPDPNAAKLEADRKAKITADAKAKKDAAAKKEMKTKAAAADLYGESIEERVDDPSMQEHVVTQMTGTQEPTSTQPQTMQPAQPQTVQPSKPPQL